MIWDRIRGIFRRSDKAPKPRQRERLEAFEERRQDRDRAHHETQEIDRRLDATNRQLLETIRDLRNKRDE